MLIWNLICIICFFLPKYLAKKVEDRCSQFHGIHDSLVECPAYDLEPDFYECYDAYRKKHWNILQYWCWNRLDNNETILKELTISTAYVNNDVLFQQINQPFTSIIHTNGSHTICGRNKNWVFPYHDDYFYCPTSTGIPVVEFRRCNLENPGW